MNNHLSTYDQIEALATAIYPRIFLHLYRSPVIATIGVSLGFTLIHVIVALVFGGLANTPGVIDLLEDGRFPVRMLILGVSIYAYSLVPRYVAQALFRLLRNGTFSNSAIYVSVRTVGMLNFMRTKYIPYLFALILVLVSSVANSILKADIVETWDNMRVVPYMLTMITSAFSCFAVGSAVLTVLLFVIVVHTSFKEQEINVFSLHPDKSGGFGPIGSLFFHLALLASILGSFLLLEFLIGILDGRLPIDYLLLFAIGLYMFFTPILLYMTVHDAHRSMVQVRKRLKEEIYSRQRILEDSSSEATDLETYARHVLQSNALTDFSKHVDSYPTWPFHLFNAIASLPMHIKTRVGKVADLSNRTVSLILVTIALTTSSISIAGQYSTSLSGWWIDWLQNFSTEIFGAFVTFILLDIVVGGRQQREAKVEELLATKEKLIRQMRNADNAIVLQAIDELRAHGWITDGSLQKALLDGTNLRSAPLWGADLENAILIEANLQDAQLFGANLQGSQLSGANLQGSQLSGANLRGAIITNTDFTGAGLKNVILPDGTLWSPDVDLKKYRRNKINNE